MSVNLATYEKSFRKNEERINDSFKQITPSLGIESDIDKNKLLQEIGLLIS